MWPSPNGRKPRVDDAGTAAAQLIVSNRARIGLGTMDAITTRRDEPTEGDASEVLGLLPLRKSRG